MGLQEHEIPIITIVNDTRHGSKGISVSTIFEITDDGDKVLETSLAYYDIDSSDLIDSITEMITNVKETTLTDLKIEVSRKDLTSLDKRTLVTIFIALKTLNFKDLSVSTYFTSYLQNVLNDVKVAYRINLGVLPQEYDTEVDMYICGTKLFNTKVDVSCVNNGDVSTLLTDVRQGTGKLNKIPIDIFSVGRELKSMDTYLCNTAINTETVPVELNNCFGKIQPMSIDIYSTNLGLKGAFPTDFKLRSLFTGDFFLEKDKYTTVSSIVWIDIIDYLYPIDLENTYLAVDGAVVSGTWFEDIPNGKRLYYNPLDDFYSDGVLIYSLHAESSIGEVEEKDFYLLYGYDVAPKDIVDWGANNRVVVRLEAQNLVFCPNKEGAAFDFVTSDLKSFNLGCTINPVGYIDLSVKILPQSKVFYYGKTYTIKLKNIKDYAGNIMPDFEYTFTIEDPK